MAKQPHPGINPSQLTYVSLSTLEKRVRRALRKQGLQLFKPRPNLAIPAGEYGITDGPYRILRSGLSLESLARELGVLAEHEALDTPQPAGLVWRVVRQRSVIEDGKPVIRYEPLSREFAHQEEAYRAAAEIGGADLAVIGYAPEGLEGRP